MSVDAIAARKASHNPDEEMEMADFAVVTAFRRRVCR
jgi:hypothetical protein